MNKLCHSDAVAYYSAVKIALNVDGSWKNNSRWKKKSHPTRALYQYIVFMNFRNNQGLAIVWVELQTYGAELFLKARGP